MGSAPGSPAAKHAGRPPKARHFKDPWAQRPRDPLRATLSSQGASPVAHAWQTHTRPQGLMGSRSQGVDSAQSRSLAEKLPNKNETRSDGISLTFPFRS